MSEVLVLEQIDQMNGPCPKETAILPDLMLLGMNTVLGIRLHRVG